MVGNEADADIATQLRFDGKALVLPIEAGLQEPLYKGWPRWQKHTAGRQFSENFPLKFSLHESPLSRIIIIIIFFNLSPVSPWKPFLVGILLSPCPH